jgi:serine/threonine protein kinase
MLSNKYEIAGKGSYGIVINPALPNKNNTGKNIKYPKNVTKIYKNKQFYNKTLITTNNIKSKIPELHINAIPYKKKYTLKNLPNSLKRRVNKYLSSVPDNAELYMLRSPNLGIAISDISRKSDYYRQVRNTSYKDICLEMYKCMNIVKAIHSAGYIHGDIRETNVLFNLDTKIMTIIDFDWLKTFDNFLMEYPVFFYSHPPECLCVWGREIQNKFYWIDNLVEEQTFKTKDEIRNIYDTVFSSNDIYLSSGAADGMLELIKHFKSLDLSPTKINTSLGEAGLITYSYAKDYIDSYGLAYTFYTFLQRAWYINVTLHPEDEVLHDIDSSYNAGGVDRFDSIEYNKFSKIREFIFMELIPKMVHSNYTKRWSIDTAITKFKYKLLEIGIDIPTSDKSIIINELRRMELLAMNYSHINNSGAPIPKELPSENNIKKTFNNIIKNETKGGRRKTRKNKRS